MPSYRIALDPKRRTAARFLDSVLLELQRALIEEKKGRGLKQAEIAKELGIDRATVNRRFTYGANLTLRTLAEMAWVLKRKPVLKLEPIEDDAHLRMNHICEQAQAVDLITMGSMATSAGRAEARIASGNMVSGSLIKADEKIAVVGAA